MLVPDSYLPILIAHDYNFLSVEGTRSDRADTEAPIHCIKFVNLDFATRVLVKIDTDEMEP